MLLSALLSIGAVACGFQTVSPSGEPVSAFEGEWWFLDGHGPEGDIKVDEPSRATMTIKESQIEGLAVCNHYDGHVRIEGFSFDAPGFSMTEMACNPSSKMEAQDAFVAALTDAQEITRQGDELTLKGPFTRVRFRFHPQPPPPQLVGTRWQFVGLSQGRGPGGLLSHAGPARLMFTPENKMTGTTGCRRFTATWKEEGDQINVKAFKLSGICKGNDSQGDQEAHMVRVLSHGFTFEIREQFLDLYELQGDLGLLYETGLR